MTGTDAVAGAGGSGSASGRGLAGACGAAL